MSESEVTVADGITELPGCVIETVSEKTRQSCLQYSVRQWTYWTRRNVTCSQLPLSMQVFHHLVWHIESGVQEGGRTRL